MHAKSLQLCLNLCDAMDCNMPVPGILLSWNFPGKNTGVGCLCPPPGDLPNPWMEPMTLMSPTLAGVFFPTSATWEAQRLEKEG